MDDQWHVARGKQKFGPYTFAQLRQIAAEGRIVPTDMVLKVGTQKWMPASAFTGLFEPSTPATPPPPQPAVQEQPSHPVAVWIATARKRLSGVPTWGWAAGGGLALGMVLLICLVPFSGKPAKTGSGDEGGKNSKDTQTASGKGGNSERKFYTSDELNRMSLDEIKRALGPPTEVYHPRRSVNVIVFIWKTGDNEYTVVTTNAAGERPNALVETSLYTVNRVKKSFD
jgi:hypothetical protein